MLRPLNRHWRVCCCSRGLFLQILPEILDFVEKPMRLGTMLFGRTRGFEFPKQFLLTLSQVDRGLNPSLDEHITPSLRTQHGHAFALEAVLVAGRGAGRDGDPGPLAIDRRHFDNAA